MRRPVLTDRNRASGGSDPPSPPDSRLRPRRTGLRFRMPSPCIAMCVGRFPDESVPRCTTWAWGKRGDKLPCYRVGEWPGRAGAHPEGVASTAKCRPVLTDRNRASGGSVARENGWHIGLRGPPDSRLRPRRTGLRFLVAGYPGRVAIKPANDGKQPPSVLTILRYMSLTTTLKVLIISVIHDRLGTNYPYVHPVSRYAHSVS